MMCRLSISEIDSSSYPKKKYYNAYFIGEKQTPCQA